MKERLTVIIAAAMLLAGCSKTDSASEGASSAAESTLHTSTAATNNSPDSEDEGTYNGVTYLFPDGTPVLSFEKRYEKTAEKYPDKTILVWALDIDVRFENELNEYLVSQGKDYVICFDNIIFAADNFGINGETVSYTMKLDNNIAAGAEYDIVSSGGVYMNIDGFSGTYKRCVDKGYFVPLDRYLFDTEPGRKLYSLMPEEYWDTLRIDGSIYGFDGELTSFRYSTGFMFNTEITEREGIDANLFTGSCYDIVRQLIDRCKGNEMMLQFQEIYALAQEEAPGELITQCVYIENGKAKNLFESENAARLFDKVCEGFNNGNVYPLNKAADISKLLAATRSYPGGGYIFDGMTTSDENGILGIIPAYLHFPDALVRISQADMATGVYSGSKHKDMAFDALASVMSDKELNDLICFGTDRDNRDGVIYSVQENTFNTVGIENLFLRSPTSSESIADRDKLRQAYEQGDMMKTAYPELDLTAVEKQMSSTNMTVLNIPAFFPDEKYKNGSEYLEELNRLLYSQGLQDIIDEINRQLEGG